jgi:hypothetical protein
MNATPRESKRRVFKAQSQSRARLAVQLAGMGTAFEQAAGLGPQLLELQAGLLAGLARSQQVDAQRLEEKHGADNELALAARARAERFDALRVQAGQMAEVVARVATTFQIDGMFHGYVVRTDGTDASGYQVRLSLTDVASGRRILQKAAKTAADGYFRIDVTVANEQEKAPRERADAQDWAARIARAMAEDPQDAATVDAHADDSSASTAATATLASQVEVVDPAGRLVHEDPAPPTFEGIASEFRYYAVPAEPTAPRAGPEARRGAARRG